MQPGSTLATAAHEPASREHLTLQTGMLEVSAGAESQGLPPGEMACYMVDMAHRIHNPGTAVAQARLVMLHSAQSGATIPQAGELRAVALLPAWLSCRHPPP